MRRLTLSLLGLLGLVACESVDSSDILTSGIYPDLTATASGDGTTLVSATLKVGGSSSNTYLELTGDDELVAYAGDQRQDFSDKRFGDYFWYEAAFDVDDAERVFTVALDRTVDDGAPDSQMSLPEPFEIGAPAPNAAVSRGDDLEVTWTNPGHSDPMSWSLDGTCLELTSGIVDADDGALTIDSSDMVATEVGESCTVTLKLTRARVGSIDPAFEEGGSAVGAQERQVLFESTPADDESTGSDTGGY